MNENRDSYLSSTANGRQKRSTMPVTGCLRNEYAANRDVDQVLKRGRLDDCIGVGGDVDV